MADILRRIGTRTPTPATVYEALTTLDGLRDWWTEDAKGDGAVGGTLEFRFSAGGFDMEVTEAQPPARVAWRVVTGPDEWVGTTIEWDLRQDGDYTIVNFAHRDWRDPAEFMSHCSTKWASFLLSLKSLAETGEGAPAPRDIQISDWH